MWGLSLYLILFKQAQKYLVSWNWSLFCSVFCHSSSSAFCVMHFLQALKVKYCLVNICSYGKLVGFVSLSSLLTNAAKRRYKYLYRSLPLVCTCLLAIMSPTCSLLSCHKNSTACRRVAPGEAIQGSFYTWVNWSGFFCNCPLTWVCIVTK